MFDSMVIKNSYALNYVVYVILDEYCLDVIALYCFVGMIYYVSMGDVMHGMPTGMKFEGGEFNPHFFHALDHQRKLVWFLVINGSNYIHVFGGIFGFCVAMQLQTDIFPLLLPFCFWLPSL